MITEFALHRRFTPPPPRDELPPQNIEAEESILGGILFDPLAIKRCKDEGLEPDHFSLNAHQALYKAFLIINGQGDPTDFTTVNSWLFDHNLLDKIGGQSKLVQLLDRAVSTVNIDEYAKLVIDKWQRRAIITKSHELIATAQSGAARKEDLRSLKHQLNALLEMKGVPSKRDFTQLDTQLKELDEDDSPYRDIELKRLAKEWEFSGLREMKAFHARWLLTKEKAKAYTLDEYEELCADMKMDWILPSFIPRQSLMCLYSPGGVGKTWLLFSILRRLVEGTGWGGFAPQKPVKALCIVTDQGRRQNNRMLDLQEYYSLPRDLKKNFIMIDEKWSTANNGQLRELIRSHRPDIVVIDSLTSVSAGSIIQENEAPFAIPLIHWREMCTEFNCSFMVIHHANKGGNGQVRGGMMRGTTAIFNTCDEVWKLEPKNPALPQDGNILEIEKSRSRDLCKFLLKRDPETDTWIPMHEIDGEDELELNSPLQQQILDFLVAHGGKHENEEIAHALDISLNTIRKELGRMASSGVIGVQKGNRKRSVYFSHFATDPTDPQLIQPSGSGGSAPSETAKPPEPQGLRLLSEIEKKSPDPTDPPDPQKKPDLKREVKKRKKCGSVGSGRLDDPQTQTEAGIPPDPKSRISSDQLDQLEVKKPKNPPYCEKEEVIESEGLHSVTEKRGFKPGDRVGFTLLHIEEPNVAKGRRKKVNYHGVVSDSNGGTTYITPVGRLGDDAARKEFPPIPWIRHCLPDHSELIAASTRSIWRIESLERSPEPTPDLPKKGDRVYVPLDGHWELVEVRRVHKKVFSADRLTKFDREKLETPIAHGLKEWRPQPDPIYIYESAGIKDKKGWVQGWWIKSIDRTHYHCYLTGVGERKAIGKREVNPKDLRFPDWVYDPIED
ncbi:MAG: AAA family ATPase [Roseofilum sp. SBFL]|uniref:AAA family ATPase n=1 Tax=Roseofilum sp. SBFL TaxID=2821496 RepID=UPI001B084286|nr:DnaB-like helicase N-terminal domain-containing protein [Roseofilum sp. SBFL]MBP0043362.1 AAA family ATPase [Roseofilum sp. SBFL]